VSGDAFPMRCLSTLPCIIALPCNIDVRVAADRAADVASRQHTEGAAMASRRAILNEANFKRGLKGLESGLRALGDISEELATVRKNLRRYLDEVERFSGHFPRFAPPPRLRPRTRRR